MKPLFVYGTLRDPAWRETILGAAYPARPATLHGYCRIANASGYLSLRATADSASSVAGTLLELDELGWQIADAWEDVAVTFPPNDGAPMNAAADVTLYARVDVTVATAEGAVAATAYVCPDGAGAPVDDDARLALRGDAEVEAAIAAFVPRMRAIRARVQLGSGWRSSQ